MKDILGDVLKAFEEQRRVLEAQLEDIAVKEQAVIDAFSANGHPDRVPSVPDDKYQEVIDYLREHPESRQADIAKHLQLNSGIISSAMKIALGRNEAIVDRPGRGARYKAA